MSDPDPHRLLDLAANAAARAGAALVAGRAEWLGTGMVVTATAASTGAMAATLEPRLALRKRARADGRLAADEDTPIAVEHDIAAASDPSSWRRRRDASVRRHRWLTLTFASSCQSGATRAKRRTDAAQSKFWTPTSTTPARKVSLGSADFL